jgi:hypothetical protein
MENPKSASVGSAKWACETLQSNDFNRQWVWNPETLGMLGEIQNLWKLFGLWPGISGLALENPVCYKPHKPIRHPECLSVSQWKSETCGKN